MDLQQLMTFLISVGLFSVGIFWVGFNSGYIKCLRTETKEVLDEWRKSNDALSTLFLEMQSEIKRLKSTKHE